MINLRKINTRLYFDVYFLSKQNIILFFLNDSKNFSSINFIKKIFSKTSIQKIIEKRRLSFRIKN